MVCVPRVSVIVPVYNTEDWLHECLDSILGQDLEELEVILVDDGSTDGSGSICDEYAAREERVRVLHQGNRGVSAALKAGGAIARGDFLGFVGSDDWLEPGMYSQLCSIADKHHADVVTCGYVSFFADGHQQEHASSPIMAGVYDRIRLEAEVYPRMLCVGSYFEFGLAPSLATKIFARDVILPNLQSVDDRILKGEDAACTYPSLLDAKALVVTDSVFYHYRIRASSISRTLSARHLESVVVLDELLRGAFARKASVNLLPQVDLYLLYHVAQLVRAESRRTGGSAFSQVRLACAIYSQASIRRMAHAVSTAELPQDVARLVEGLSSTSRWRFCLDPLRRQAAARLRGTRRRAARFRQLAATGLRRLREPGRSPVDDDWGTRS